MASLAEGLADADAFALDHRVAMSAARWSLAGLMVLGTLLALLVDAGLGWAERAATPQQ